MPLQFGSKRFNAWLLALPMLVASGYVAADCAHRCFVSAVAETDPVPTGDDAADDPAIWIHPQHSTGLILATDKRAGLLLYDLQGHQLQYLPLGNLNNVDLRQGTWRRPRETLVAASHRDPSEVVLLSLEQDSMRMKLRARYPIPLDKAAGICMFQNLQNQPYVIVNSDAGWFIQYAVNIDYTLEEVRRWRLDGKVEGCVADDSTEQLYLAEEEVGIWRMSARADHPVELRMFAEVGTGQLYADVEGLALHSGERTVLIASSQGDSSFALYDTSTAQYLGSFKVRASEEIDDVTDTDGVAVTALPLQGFREGVLVVQDNLNENPRENQNFKIVSWTDITQAFYPESQSNGE